MLVQSRQLLSIALAAAFALAGCSGPAQTAGAPGMLPAGFRESTPASRARRHVTATLGIRIPKKVRVGGGRHPRFVSPSTQSASISIAPAAGCTACTPASTSNVGLTAASPNCAATATGTACTFTYDLAPGNYTGSMTTFDGPLNASGFPIGNVLSRDQSFPLSVVSGKANAPTISLYGVPAGITCLPVSGASLEIIGLSGCSPAEFFLAAGVASTFVVYALDVDGNLMLGPGAPTFTASASGGYTFVTKGNTIVVTPPVITSSVQSFTITATSPACQVTGAVCSYMEVIGFDSLVAIADGGNNTVSIFSRLAIAAGAGAPYAVVSNGISGPLAETFDKNGNLFVVNGTSNTVTEYAPPYNGAPVVTMTQGLNGPFALAIGKSGALGILNGGTATAEVFAPPYTGAPIQITLGSTTATALAFDSNQNLWIAFFNNLVDRLSAASSYASLTNVLNNASNGIFHPTALALDSGNNLFVGEGKVDQFTSPNYSGMPSVSSNAVADIAAMSVNQNHGDIAVCGLNSVSFFRTFNLGEYYTQAVSQGSCTLAFDRLENLEMAFASPPGAQAISFSPTAQIWGAGPTFTSPKFSAPVAVATWP